MHHRNIKSKPQDKVVISLQAVVAISNPHASLAAYEKISKAAKK
jgi:hypothetical protein